MQTPRYSLHQYPIETLLGWIRSGQIAVPEIQRPFVWTAPKVRNFIDSLYHGYPVGYIITWPKSEVPLRAGQLSIREHILIDGQQRMMALRAALLGKEILTKKYKEQRIQIAFHPDREEFAVSTRAIQQDSGWISDISTVFNSNSGLFQLIEAYCERNVGVNRYEAAERIGRLYEIRNNSLGVVELSADLDVETVVEIFVRINGTGVSLSAADFVMSKMAASEQHNGHLLRQSVDYFCHLATVPEAYDRLAAADSTFAATDYFRAMEWLKNWRDNIYVPAYTDMLRVVFASKFKRGDLTNLVDLLSGDSVEDTFHQLEDGIRNYINRTHFKRFVRILRSAGFIDASMLTARNAVNSAYILFLSLRAQNTDASQIEKLVRQWFVMSVLTGRYSGEPQATLGEDVRGMNAENGPEAYLEGLKRSELSDAFWNEEFRQNLNASGFKNVYFNLFLASQIKVNDKGFLSSESTVRDLFASQRDIHHIFPKNHLREIDIAKSKHNQLANLVVTQEEINRSIGDAPPARYFSELQTGCRAGEPRYGGIDNLEDLHANFKAHCIPFSETDTEIFENYDEFLEERKKLMVTKIRDYYFSL
ncbi:MAG: DUF262 domain-containing protein [Candidatus Poribacteria bacterium]|nr:DUF262 domain-containing protein [Candidatus Poribacteria bacterium]